MKRTCWIVSIGLALCIAIYFSYNFFVRDFLVRRDLKLQCSTDVDCVCFANVIDNRLTHDQVRAFSNFLTSVKTRQDTNILEFTDEENARKISDVLSICRKNKL